MDQPCSSKKQKIVIQENSSAEMEISQHPSGQELALDQNKDSGHNRLMDDSKKMKVVEYGCGHFDAEPLKHTVDILGGTLNFMLLEGDTQKGPVKGHFEFDCAPYVDGSVTVEYYRMVVGSPGTSPTKERLTKSPPKTHKAEQRPVTHVEDEMGFDILLVGLKEQYKVEILSVPTEGDLKVYQLTLAVIEKVKGEIKIRVTDQIIWLNNIPYLCHVVTGIFKSLNMVNDGQCPRCLDLSNPGSRVPFENIKVNHGEESPTGMLNGTFQDRPCAVKRYPIEEKQAADNDIKMMEKVGSHSNIVSYYGMAEGENVVLVAVERCKSSLDKLIASREFKEDEYKLKLEGFKDLILWKLKKDPSSTEPPPKDIYKVYPSEHLLKILRGIVSGLCRLHSHNIKHNDLKIQNVLINRDTTVVDTDVLHITAKLSNFSLSTIGVASSGGQEPTFPSDLIELGDLLLDCIAIHHDEYIMKPNTSNTKRVDMLKHLPEAHDLITQLQNLDPKLRPTAAQVKMHPFFLEPKERLDFLFYASECIQGEEYESKIRKPIFKHREYKGWDQKVDTELTEDIKRKQDEINTENGTKNSPSYHGVNLLRTIRNKYNHYRDQTEELQSVLGKNVTEFDDYFSSRFPNFFMLVYNLFKNNTVKEKNLLDEYLKPGMI